MKALQNTLRTSLVLLLAFVLFAGMIPAALAEENVIVCGTETAGEQDLVLTETAVSEPALMGTSAGERLSGDSKLVYEALLPYIRQIAAGERSSTEITLGKTVTYQGTTYTPEQEVAFTQPWESFEASKMIRCLQADLPYELYWYDVITGYKIKYYTEGVILAYMSISLTVAGSYQGEGPYFVDTAKAKQAALSVANALAIVEENKDKSDYDKLLAYKKWIIEEVIYNWDALSDDSTVNNDPWEIVYVFDCKSGTNVVCEGYSKAFQYLCDLSTFRNEVTCYSVIGMITEGDGNTISHMWNIVNIEGKNYLADVTNSDYGRIGERGGLFLAGAGEGSATEGYNIGSVNYTYTDATLAIWGSGEESILTLTSEGKFIPSTYDVVLELDHLTLNGPSA